MYYLLSLHTSARRIFWVSFLMFSVLNLVENLIHYNIGRDADRESLAIPVVHMPSGYDIARIVSIMVVFGVLQALGTCYFLGCDE